MRRRAILGALSIATLALAAAAPGCTLERDNAGRVAGPTPDGEAPASPVPDDGAAASARGTELARADGPVEIAANVEATPAPQDDAEEIAAPQGRAPAKEPPPPPKSMPAPAHSSRAAREKGNMGSGFGSIAAAPPPTGGAEGYDHLAENDFVAVAEDPRSTFSIDVDTASYSNVRRFLDDGNLPPVDAVRIEEMVNYFAYDYDAPMGEVPFAMSSEVAPCPWNEDHLLARIGLQGKVIDQSDVPARNLVFLLDVSGSMNSPDKLPLLVKGLSMLVESLRPEDRVSIVVYAGSSGMVLAPTAGDDKATIVAALRRLEAGGSTNGGAGIELAYRLAEKSFVDGGINRVILATDGDFNVGVQSRGDLERLIEAKRKSGVFLSVLGFGTGNLQDSTMEQLADKGNGNYAYIDSESEARKVLVEEAGATLFTIAKDVKIQVELNPAEVVSYRLIGYENRKLSHQDFDNDRKDAGEIGAGHAVTALYEIVPAGTAGKGDGGPVLEYQETPRLTAAARSGELMSVKVRYKDPAGSTSKLLAFKVHDEDRDLETASKDFRFAAAVAELGLLLRGSEHRGDATYGQVLALAETAIGKDPHGHRRGFLDLARRAKQLAGARGAIARTED